MKKQQYRQGDVFLIPVTKLPNGAAAIVSTEDRIILAFGEATGHHHSLKATVGNLFERDGKRYLHMDIDAPLVHQEHSPILIPRGTYQVVIQREYSPEAIRNVQD